MLKVIEMTVNGEKRQIAVDDRESLLDTLRNLGFTSVKKGCEVGGASKEFRLQLIKELAKRALRESIRLAGGEADA